MILILTDVDEPTTDLVIDWLIYLKKEFVRVSVETPIFVKKIYTTTKGMEAVFSVKIGELHRQIDTRDITSFWYRRSSISIYCKNIKSSMKLADRLINGYIRSEYESVVQILYSILANRTRINKFGDGYKVNKIWNLQIARDCGLNVPDTIICSSKKDLYRFYEEHQGEVITKPIGDPDNLFDYGLNSFTSKIDIDVLPEEFALSLFQEMVRKMFEIRIFYLHGRFFSSAIFSQSDPQTSVDLKNYNDEKPNRIVPFQLPTSIMKGLTKFMNYCNLDSGSIDMIYTMTGTFYFLEVNPVGQFEQVAVPCNYNLFKIVANEL
ncbi:MAG: grasp-with-spasm system ATP-grasp peptide maturase [Bacteroides oleiciplenus]|nr:grasp-with-spasm system ATP-grasp peptide maturase [Bacteroides oleiciplenus]